MNSTVTIVSGVLAYLSSGSGTAALIIYLVFVIGALSLYPTSILVIIFLKPVRDKLKAVIKSINRSLRDHHSSVTGTSSEIMSLVQNGGSYLMY